VRRGREKLGEGLSGEAPFDTPLNAINLGYKTGSGKLGKRKKRV